ncbi:Peptidase S8/S53 domain-containing protein [Stackebrandtia soli]
MALAYAIVVGFAIVLLAIVGAAAEWVIAQAAFVADQPWTGPITWTLTAIAAVLALLLAAPLLFARLSPALRGVGTAWVTAAAIMAVFAASRLAPLPTDQVTLLLQAAGFAVIAIVGWFLGRRTGRARWTGQRRSPGAVGLGLCVGGLALLPWPFLSSLGDPADLAIGLVTAAAFAGCAGVVFGDRFWARFAESSTVVRVLGGGTAVAVGLVPLSGAVGATGVTLLPMLILPALGYAIAALVTRTDATGRIVAAVVGPAVAGPLLFTDADEFLPLVFGPEHTSWQPFAIGASIVIAWLAGAALTWQGRRWSAIPAVAAGCAIVVAAGVGAVYSFSQPGFHGEELFVVLDEQADLSGVEGTRTERLTIVHDRLKTTAERTQEPLRAELDRRGIAYTPMYLVNALRVDASILARDWIADRDDVRTVLVNPRNRPSRVTPAPITGHAMTDQPTVQPNIDQIGAPVAWERGVTGDGITIGIPDSGVDARHPALASAYRGGDDSWADPVNGTTSPIDPNGHGTHVAGIAVGSDGIGVAPDATWMGCANLPRNAGNPADYVECLQFMLAPYAPGEDPFSDGDPTRAPHIVSNSWGCPGIEGCAGDVFGQAIAAFDAAGVFFVVAAGNSGPACGSADTEPVGYPDAFAVGAVDGSDRVTSFSSRGPATVDGVQVSKPDIAAPGQDTAGGAGILSALPGDGYGRLPGTSMAAPHVAGVVALLWSADPELLGDPAATRELLRDTASPINEEGLTGCVDPESAAGAGIVDVAAALAARGLG